MDPEVLQERQRLLSQYANAANLAILFIGLCIQLKPANGRRLYDVIASLSVVNWKIRLGSSKGNVVMNVLAKFRDDRLRSNKAFEKEQAEEQ